MILSATVGIVIWEVTLNLLAMKTCTGLYSRILSSLPSCPYHNCKLLLSLLALVTTERLLNRETEKLFTIINVSHSKKSWILYLLMFLYLMPLSLKLKLLNIIMELPI
jgi:hypothetical protein